MRRLDLNLSVTVHICGGTRRTGNKMELPTGKFPGGLLQTMYNLPFQWRVWWGGPTDPNPPALRALWGWQPTDGWFHGHAYVRRDFPKLKWTCSRSALRLQIGQDMLPPGKWPGQLTCEPDEEAPAHISLIARPAIYLPRPAAVVRPTPERPTSLLPRLGLPGDSHRG